MKKALNWGVIGLGVGVHHLAALLEDPNCSTVRIWDIDPERIEKINELYPSAIGCASEEEIIGSSNVQGVSICSYDDVHARQVVHAIESGQHVFVEKPLCLEKKELSQISKALDRHPEISLSSNMVLRANDLFKKIRDQIREGQFGNIFSMEVDYLWGRAEKLRGWRAEVEGYSMVLGAGIHAVDLLLWMMGERPVKVQAMGNSIGTSGVEIDCETFVSALLEFPGGLVAKISANAPAVHPHFHSLRLFGSRKSAIHDIAGSVWLTSSPEGTVIEPIEAEYPDHANKRQVIQSFLTELTEERPQALVSKADVFDAMAVCFAIEESIATRNPVAVDYI